MNQIQKLVNQLKDCVTPNEVKDLLAGQSLKGSESNFGDNKISLPSSGSKITHSNVYIQNEILHLAFKTLLFLKLNGYLKFTPQRSGKTSYLVELQSTLSLIEKIQPHITSTSDIELKTIESTIERLESNGLTIDTINTKLSKLLEWGTYANDYLPYFLQFDTSIILCSEKYADLRHQLSDKWKRNSLVGSTREPYNLKKMKKIVKAAIDYTEYKEDIIIATKIYMKGKADRDSTTGRHDAQSRKLYSTIFNALKSTQHEFKEPNLRKLKNKILKMKTAYKNERKQTSCGLKTVNKGRSVSNMVKTLVDCIWRLETSCIIITLITTAMRTDELISLERYPRIDDGEYFSLKKMVYKTAATEEGEEHVVPIPAITKTAIDTLSELSTLKSGDEDDKLITAFITYKNRNKKPDNFSGMVARFSKELGIDDPPIPHMFRHTMAFLVAYINEKDGVELAQMLLKHESISMTLNYLGLYNEALKIELRRQYEKDAQRVAREISDELKNGKELFGTKGEQITGSYQFAGKIVDSFADLFTEGIAELVKSGQALILETPTNFCIHDLSKPNEMVCQRGFNIEDFTGSPPLPSRCDGGNCSNAVFTEKQIEELQVTPIDKVLRQRLETNRYFTENGGLNNSNFQRITDKYQTYKESI